MHMVSPSECQTCRPCFHHQPVTLRAQGHSRRLRNRIPAHACRLDFERVPDVCKHALLTCTAVIWLTISSPAGADDATVASFNKNCIGCHVGGGNIVQAGKTLQTGDLERNGAGTVEDIYDLVYSGKGKMPGYGSGCTPKGKCTFGPRLSDEEIQRLSVYVLDQAANGWK